MRVKAMRAVAVALGIMLIFAACGTDSNDGSAAASGDDEAVEQTDDAGTDDAGEDEAAEEVASGDVTYSALEFGFDGPDAIAAGHTSITLVNDGKQPHELAIFELRNGKSFADVTALFEGGPPKKQPKWAHTVGRTFAKPGKTSKPLMKELTAGNYVLLCFVPDKESKMPHAMLGMMKPVTVQ